MDSTDDVIGGLVKRLQTLPASDLRARAAILARVRGRRQSPWRAALAEAWQPSVPLLAAATIAVAALGVGYAGRVLVEPAPTLVDGADASPVTTPVVPVSNDGTIRVSQQFVLDARTANRVLLVGDFNGWDRTQAQPLQRLEGGVWAATVPLRPGRYTYAFLVDDSLTITLDPRASTVRDEFGRESSVILVTDR
ncbi:MAG TPA: glycogen-binding domain-containing protein [Gemmatimonadaceae bacterium]|nr:glycogen-binding domain-containing protein [Gemmatimonadaceae bacterium]